MNERMRARTVLKQLPPHVHTTTLACPLCGASVPARGLRVRALESSKTELWELVFTCPACGLVTPFRTDHLNLKQIESISGSPWANELRGFNEVIHKSANRQAQRATTRHMLSVFIISFLMWMSLIGNFNPVEVAWGLLVSLVVARLSYQFVAFNLPNWIFHPIRWRYFAELMLEFARQIVVQNLTLSLRVLHPKLPIRPGIVAIPTSLRDDVSLTILGSLMTLTPDTVTLDIDQRRGIIYVHWIDVKTEDPIEAQRLISASLEEKIIRWLH